MSVDKAIGPNFLSKTKCMVTLTLLNVSSGGIFPIRFFSSHYLPHIPISVGELLSFNFQRPQRWDDADVTEKHEKPVEDDRHLSMESSLLIVIISQHWIDDYRCRSEYFTLFPNNNLGKVSSLPSFWEEFLNFHLSPM